MRRFLDRFGQLGRMQTLRTFAFEVLVVVIGVLLALGAQELVASREWDRRVVDGEARLHGEAQEAAGVMAEQIVVAPCIIAQIDLLSTALRQPGPLTDIEPFDTPMGQMVLRAPSRSFSKAAWQSLLDDGTAARLDPQRVQFTSWVYATQDELNSLFAQAQSRRARLDFLLEPIALPPESRIDLLQSLAEMRFSTNLQALMAVQGLSYLRDLGRLDIAQRVAYEQDLPYSTTSECRARGLPLADWRAELAAIPAEHVPPAPVD